MFIRYGQWILLFWLFILRIGYSAAKDIRVVCYYTNWSVYRPGSAKFSPQNINPYLCTHLIYAFGGFTKENTLKPFDKYQDIEKGGYAKFTGLKTYNKNLKTLLAIGGWNEGSSRFSPMVANPERRKELVKNAIKFLRQNHFDGLDLDWEYPTFRDGGKPRDRENYAKLVEELREEFERESEKTGRPRLLLTMAVPAGIEYINKGYDVETLAKYLDWMNILSYDYHSAFEPAVNHHAPLYSLEEASEYNYDTELNIDYTIKHYLEMGADPSKLVVGIPTYGRSYTLFNPDANEIGAPADGPGDMGEATRENGYLAYYEICENIKSNDWTVVQPNDKAMGPYAYKDNQWVGYDDENIARRKAEYVAENGLGGIMFWAIDNDDFRGNCHGRPYPIIEAAKEALLAASGITEDNLISPPSKPTKPKTRSRNKTKLTSHQAEQTEISKSETPKPSAGSIRRRNRLKNKSRPSSTTERSRRITKKENTSTYSSLKVVTPSYTTPAPPSTPDQGGGFKCEDEGFFPHPKDCKKYYWCLSGPGELGIIAHQFTCPAGLYFNKAADSCDYTQNVLCNKKLSKATTTTTTTTTPSSKSTTEVTRATPSSLFFTSRVPPKITAATSRTTFKQSTTTEATYDDEYEYDDEETGIRNEKDSEEDPKVIKELIDLIKKAGGIEELEKQLKIHETNPSTGSLGTTPSTLTKTLVERFFSKSNKNNPKTVSYNTINRNSRGPQNVGLNQNDVSSNEKSAKSRPTYTSIIRQRPTTEKIEKDEETGNESENEKTELESKSRKTLHPEYVNIRRPKVSADEESTNRSNFNRNKILGEGSQEEEEGGSKEEKPLFVRNSTPQYINIRRSRPTTTEGSVTSKYTEIRRGSSRSTTQPQQTTEDSSTTSSYKTVSRSTTNSDIVNIKDTKDSSTPKYVIVTRGSTVHLQPIPVEITTSLLNVDITTEPVATTIVPESASVSKNFNLGTTVLINQQNIPISTTEFSINGAKQTLITNKRTTPILLEPRPFSFPTRGSTTSLRPISEVSTEKSKVSDKNYKFRLKEQSASTSHVSDSVTENPQNVSTRRGISRFNLKTTEASLNVEETPKSLVGSQRQKKRFSTTTERNEINDFDARQYRPTAIEDLSSLTAADIEINKFRKGAVIPTYRRRVRPLTRTTTEGSSDSVEATSKVLPKPPISRRQNLFVKNLDESQDQIISGSDDAANTRRVQSRFYKTTDAPVSISTARGRGFAFKQQDVATLEPPLSKLANRGRRVRPVLKESAESTTARETLDNSNHHFGRTRKVIRRFRSTTPKVDTNERFELSPSIRLNSYNRKLFNRPNFNPFTKTQGLTLVTNEDENENESVEDVNQEDENIKLSESNIRQSSDNALSFQDKKAFSKGFKEFEKPRDRVTEPNIIVRTRKIVRKLKPTKPSIVDSTTTTTPSPAHRTRKIIRKLRPITETFPIITDKVEETTTETQDTNTESLLRSFTLQPIALNEEISSIRSYAGSNKSSETTTDLDTTLSDISTEPIKIELESTTVKEKLKTSSESLKQLIGRGRNRFRQTTQKLPITRRNKTNLIRASTSLPQTTILPVEDDAPTEELTTNSEPSNYNVIAQTFVDTENEDAVTTLKYEPEKTTLLNDIIETTLLDNVVSDDEGKITTLAMSTLESDEPETTDTIYPELNEIDSTTPVDELTTTNIKIETTSQRRTRLRTVNLRPKFTVPKRITEEPTSPSSTTARTKNNTRKRLYRPTFRTTSTFDSPTKAPKRILNRKLYRTSTTTERITKNDDESIEENIDDFNEDERNEENENSDIKFRTKSTIEAKPRKFSSTTRIPNRIRSGTTRSYSFKRTTEPSTTTTVREDLTISRARNKNLFSKKRKMNIPVYASTPTTEEAKQVDTTENPTTFYHVFAETITEINPETTPTPSNETGGNNSLSKVERLIEVNRIVEVHAKNEYARNTSKGHIPLKEDLGPVLNKLGAISRVTVIKVVDNNDTKNSSSGLLENDVSTQVDTAKETSPFTTMKAIVREVNLADLKNLYGETPSNHREERKFEIYDGSSKVHNHKTNEAKKDTKSANSGINIITPKPKYSTEASTIALEGLFQSDSPKKVLDNSDSDIFEFGNSRFVNIRILKPDESRSHFEVATDKTNLVPIRLLEQDGEVTMRAKVVEVAPKNNQEKIKIVPIQVAMARKIVDHPIVGLQNLNKKIGETPFFADLSVGVPKNDSKSVT